MGKVFLILGIIGIILGGGVAFVSLLLPQMTRNVKMDEAMIGVIAGAVVLLLGKTARPVSLNGSHYCIVSNGKRCYNSELFN